MFAEPLLGALHLRGSGLGIRPAHGLQKRVSRRTPPHGSKPGDLPLDETRAPPEELIMKSHRRSACAALLLVLATWPAMAGAQLPDTAAPPAVMPIDTEPPVIVYDLSGPRLGFTLTPNGEPVSQFGWHFEHQAAPSTQGPWFIVEPVLLAGGLERDAFVLSGTLAFGMRLPNGFEFGVGPSLSLGGSSLSSTAVVVAAGQSFRAGGIRVPVNIAVALDKGGSQRVTLLTGWAIRDRTSR